MSYLFQNSFAVTLMNFHNKVFARFNLYELPMIRHSDIRQSCKAAQPLRTFYNKTFGYPSAFWSRSTIRGKQDGVENF